MLRRTTCRVCNATISREDIDQANSIAVCHNCGTVTRLNAPDDKPKSAPAAAFQDFSPRGDARHRRATANMTAFLPEGIEQALDHEALKITLRREAMYGSVVGAVAMLGMMGFFGLIFFSQFIGPAVSYGFRGGFAMSPFVLFMVGIFLLIAYTGLTTLLNRVEITISPDRIHTRSLPLPTLNYASVNPADILQVYCRDRLHQSKNSTWKTYEVRAILNGGRHVNIVTGLGDAMPALYIEEAIEDYLNLTDAPVTGELRRR